MKITINTLINQIKKVIVNKSSIPEASKAYVNSNGDIIASNYTDRGIVAFIAGVFADAAAENLNKLYSKDSLSLYTKTGALVGGADLPENYKDAFVIPEDNYTVLCTVTPETLKNTAAAVSRDNTRTFITGFHINTSEGFIESVDGFRSYRAPVDIVGKVDREVIIPGVVANYGYKGNVEIAAGEKYARLRDTITGFTVYTQYTNAVQFVQLSRLYEYGSKYAAVTVKNLETLVPYLKTACKLDRENRVVYIRFKGGRLDYSIPPLDVYGSLETDIKDLPEGAAAYNALYMLDAITAAGNTLHYDTKSTHNAPIIVGNTGAPEALLLPIHFDCYQIADAFKPLDIVGNKQQETPAPAAPEETKHDNTAAASDLPNNEETTPEVNQEDNRQEMPADFPADPTLEETTTPEAAAVADINEKQNKDNHFVNISPEDVKRQQAITAAQAYYKALQGYKLTSLQELTATAIYKANKAVLQPIARQAGGLYIDSIAIIAAITAAADIYELQEV